MAAVKNRYDFVLFFDVADGNPNGDPDAGNMPRVDNETGYGLVSDVCLKRKIRNYIQLTGSDTAGYDIFIKEKAVLNNEINAAYDSEEVKNASESDKVNAARDWMCARYYDVRAFGAVMTTGKNAGQVRGPIQLTFARSLDPVNVVDNTVTRLAVTAEKDAAKERSMGRKYTIPYALYAVHGFVSPNFADQTMFSEEDLAFFFKALSCMFDYDRSSSRGEMNSRRLVVFRHDDKLGNAPSWKLFNLVHAQKVDGVTAPRSFDDYQITVDAAGCPAGVEILEMI